MDPEILERHHLNCKDFLKRRQSSPQIFSNSISLLNMMNGQKSLAQLVAELEDPIPKGIYKELLI